MKSLIIVRHAKSSWADSGKRDFDRPLNERGEHDVAQMGKRLKKLGVQPDLMISSPALRAISTCEVIAGRLQYPLEKVRRDDRMYHAGEVQLLAILRELDNFGDPRAVMLFGHNPGMTAFANRLLDVRIDNIPTCGVVGGKLDIDAWRNADWNCGTLDFFDSPKGKSD